MIKHNNATKLNTKYMTEVANFNFLQPLDEIAHNIGTQALTHTLNAKEEYLNRVKDGLARANKHVQDIEEHYRSGNPNVTIRHVDDAHNHVLDLELHHDNLQDELEHHTNLVNDPNYAEDRKNLGYKLGAGGLAAGIGTAYVGSKVLGNNNNQPKVQYIQQPVVQAQYSKYMTELASFNGVTDLVSTGVKKFIDEPLTGVAEGIENTGKNIYNKVVSIPGELEKRGKDSNSAGNRFKRFITKTKDDVVNFPSYVDSKAGELAKNLDKNVNVLDSAVKLPSRTIEAVHNIKANRLAKKNALESARRQEQFKNVTTNLITPKNLAIGSGVGLAGIGGLSYLRSNQPSYAYS